MNLSTIDDDPGAIWLEVARLLRLAPYAIDEADALFDRYTRGEISAQALLEQMRALAVRH